ncbi:MAG: GSCFA family protein [Desulfuromonas sp.]|nr:MAG: GSCFA family protein [Desulfuromonas sp.]
MLHGGFEFFRGGYVTILLDRKEISCMSTPYQKLPDRSFWSRAISPSNFLSLKDVYQKKFDICADDKIVTAGSCFAQHIARHLQAKGYCYKDYEPKPPYLSQELASSFNYGVYSARYCNIYTARQLRQTFERAFGLREPSEDVWSCQDGYLDPFRPTVEPGPYQSVEEFAAARKTHLEAIRNVFTKSDIFIFTFGLTEAWQSKTDGSIFPVCPGTRAPWNKEQTLGAFDSSKYEFKNFTFNEIISDFTWLIEQVRKINPSVRFLLTVSPVPLVATATGKNVLTATMYSKSVLRAVAGDLSDNDNSIDYYPSY